MTAPQRGPGGWPIDPAAAFQEAQGKFHEARKEADHWRSNHADLLRRFKIAQVYKEDLIESAALLRRVIAESAPAVPEELHRAIGRFLEKVAENLETPRDGPSR